MLFSIKKMFSSHGILVFVLFTICLNCSYCSENVKPRANSDDLLTRLSTNSFPIHYDLSMVIDVEGGTFNGTAKINLNVTEPTDNILLNFEAGTDLSYHTLIRTFDNFPVSLSNFDQNADQEYIRISYTTTLEIGNYDLTLFFFGNIRDDLMGLYFSSYWKDGIKNTVALTTFASSHARKVFPCYDEPAFKATFTVHIKHAAKYHALSNMPVSVINEDDTDWPITSFEPSVRMSTYLLAFAVTDFQQNLNTQENVSVYAQPDKFHLTNYAVDFGIEARKIIENYVQRQYQLPKMDLVAFDDFLFSAMENWGLITFTSRSLLYDTVTQNDLMAKQSLSQTITHEIIHMWFGNEVTCEWFSATWLNEGITTFLTQVLTDAHVPEWGIRDQFVLRPTQFAMYRDALPTARAMTRDVITFGDLDAVYGYESYDKAAAVIRMMLHVMSNDVFKAGLQLYLERRSFQSASPTDLYSAFESTFSMNPPPYSRDIPISTVFTSWANIAGFPVVTAHRNYDNSSLTVSQERFHVTLDGLNGISSNYFIPLNYAHRGNADFGEMHPTHWLTTSSNNFPISATGNDWIILNKEVSGYYRVNYDTRNWNMISTDMQNENPNIPVRNRAQLIDDALNLARYGYLSYDVALEVTRYLKKETHYVPLKAAFNNFQTLEISLRGANTTFQEYIFEILDNLYTDLGMVDSPDDEHMHKLLRYDVAHYACQLGQEECIRNAYLAYAFSQHGPISPDFWPAVFCGAVQHPTGAEVAFRSLLNRLRTLTVTEGDRAENSREINAIIAGFRCLRSEELQTSAFDIARQGTDHLQRSHRINMFVAVASGSYSGLMMSLTYLTNNYRNLEVELGSLAEIFRLFGTHIHSEELERMFLQIEAFVNDGSDATILAYNQAKADIEWNRQWMNRNVDVIDKWLKGGVEILRSAPFLIASLMMLLSFFA